MGGGAHPNFVGRNVLRHNAPRTDNHIVAYRDRFGNDCTCSEEYVVANTYLSVLITMVVTCRLDKMRQNHAPHRNGTMVAYLYVLRVCTVKDDLLADKRVANLYPPPFLPKHVSLSSGGSWTWKGGGQGHGRILELFVLSFSCWVLFHTQQENDCFMRDSPLSAEGV